MTAAELKKYKSALERAGYEVKMKVIPIRIGDIVRMNEDGATILVTMEDEEPNGWTFGGTVVGKQPAMDPLWIEDLTYNEDSNAYTIIGHIDLSKAITK